MRIATRLLLATAFVAASVAAIGGCPGGKGLGGGKLPGGGGVPGVPGGVPASGLDPNACGGYASSDAGRKLKAFLVATQDVQTITVETLKVVKQSCITLGNELGMTDLSGEAKEVCAKVYGQVDENLKVAVKGKAALKVQYKPAVCKLDVSAQASAAASCEGKASADIKATCSGACRGKCDGTCSAKNASGECAGECKGTCQGSCEGSADVDASVECQASAQVKASAEMQCTEPELKIAADAKLVVDKSKADQTIRALMAALPQIFSVKARLVPLKHAVEVWARSAAALSAEGQKLAQQFGDQAMCVAGQIAFAAKAATSVQANISVSVEVSASASGSVGTN